MPRIKKSLMNPEPGAPDAVRRALLTGGALTVAASAAAQVLPREAEAVEPADPQDRTRLNYRVTDHIAAYYRRARE